MRSGLGDTDMSPCPCVPCPCVPRSPHPHGPTPLFLSSRTPVHTRGTQTCPLIPVSCVTMACVPTSLCPHTPCKNPSVYWSRGCHHVTVSCVLMSPCSPCPHITCPCVLCPVPTTPHPQIRCPGVPTVSPCPLTTVQLGHVALLHHPCRCVHFGVDDAPRPVQLHRKGRWLVHCHCLLWGHHGGVRDMGGRGRS